MSNIEIKIVLVGVLKHNLFGERTCIFSQKTTMDEIIKALGLPRQHLGTILVNGKHAELTSHATNGDTLTFLPVIGGG